MLAIKVSNAQQAMEMKQQVLDHGLRQDHDFTWEYIPNQYDGWDYTTQSHPMVRFYFVEQQMETFFQLRWS